MIKMSGGRVTHKNEKKRWRGRIKMEKKRGEVGVGVGEIKRFPLCATRHVIRQEHTTLSTVRYLSHVCT